VIEFDVQHSAAGVQLIGGARSAAGSEQHAAEHCDDARLRCR
jgi:hypothetical protein